VTYITNSLQCMLHAIKTYRVIQEVRSIFGETVASVIVRKKVHVNMCLILNGYRDRAVCIYKYNSIVNDNKEKVLTVKLILI
jgi:hypothetical protein